MSDTKSTYAPLDGSIDLMELARLVQGVSVTDAPTENPFIADLRRVRENFLRDAPPERIVFEMSPFAPTVSAPAFFGVTPPTAPYVHTVTYSGAADIGERPAHRSPTWLAPSPCACGHRWVYQPNPLSLARCTRCCQDRFGAPAPRVLRGLP